MQARLTSFINMTDVHELASHQSFLPAETVEYRHFPIRDVGVPQTPRQMRGILDAIDGALAAGRNVYVHCWGGIGRMADEALQELAGFWRTVARRHRCPYTPETAEQVAWVRNWQEHAHTPAPDCTPIPEAVRTAEPQP